MTNTTNLWALAKGGNREAYNLLYARVERRAYAYAARRLPRDLYGEAEPADIAQEAFLQTCEEFGTFQDESSGAFLFWLFRLIDNKIHSLREQVRARSARRARPAVPRSKGPRTRFLEKEQAERLERALDQLPEVERKVIVLIGYEGMNVADVAKTLGLPDWEVRRLRDDAARKLEGLL